MKSPAARIVYAWEWGTASGHLRRFLPIASALTKADCEVILVVKEPQRAADVFREFEVPILPCPSLKSPPTVPCQQPHSIAGLAWNLGVNASPSVTNAIYQWKNLLMALRPTHLISDFGLLANIVANALGIPTARIGTGFGTPPESDALASMFDRPVSRSELDIAASIEHLLRNSMVANRLPCPKHWDELCAVTGPTLVATVPDFDPYRLHRAEGAQLGVWGVSQGHSPLWKDSGRQKALAYLKPNAQIESQCRSLASLGIDILLVWNETGQKPTAVASMPHIQISDELVDIDACRGVCTLTISNANHGFLIESLSLGIPVAAFPLFIENHWNISVAQRLGFGINFAEHQEHTWGHLVDLLNAEDARSHLAWYANRLNQFNGTALDRALQMLTRWIFPDTNNGSAAPINY